MPRLTAVLFAQDRDGLEVNKIGSGYRPDSTNLAARALAVRTVVADYIRQHRSVDDDQRRARSSSDPQRLARARQLHPALLDLFQHLLNGGLLGKAPQFTGEVTATLSGPADRASQQP